MTIRVGIRTWLAVIVVGLVLWFTISYTGLLLEIVWIIFGALLMGLAIRPIASYLTKWHIPRSVTVIGVFAIMIAAVAVTVLITTPVIRDDWTVLQRDGPTMWQQIPDRLKGTIFASWLPSAKTISSEVSRVMDPALVSAVGTVSGVGQLLLDLLVMLILSYFYATGAISGQMILGSWISEEHQDRVAKITRGIENQLTVWVWAQVGMAVFVAVVFGIVLALMGVPYAWTIGLASGLLSVIPYLGAVVATILGMLSAFTVSAWLALWVLLFSIAISAAVSHLLAPFLYGRALGLRSVFVLLALFIGVKFLGFIGLIFAIPLTVVLAAIIQELHNTPHSDEPIEPPKTLDTP